MRRFIAAFSVRHHPGYADMLRESIPGSQSDIKMSHSKGADFKVFPIGFKNELTIFEEFNK
jgi:hypothetical protein